MANTIDVIGDDALIDSIINRTITEIKDDNATSIGVYAFYSCSSLTSVEFSNATSIGDSAFRTCSELTTLILSKTDAICTLSYTNAFNSTLIASGTGYIYVPKALVETYKSATNWSAYANQIRAIEDYTVDGTITGALDESKI